jgi:hypothetical protein
MRKIAVIGYMQGAFRFSIKSSFWLESNFYVINSGIGNQVFV